MATVIKEITPDAVKYWSKSKIMWVLADFNKNVGLTEAEITKALISDNKQKSQQLEEMKKELIGQAIMLEYELLHHY